eukprot:2488921-Pleurochrysis_carterae.AAC.1
MDARSMWAHSRLEEINRFLVLQVAAFPMGIEPACFLGGWGGLAGGVLVGMARNLTHAALSRECQRSSAAV